MAATVEEREPYSYRRNFEPKPVTRQSPEVDKKALDEYIKRVLKGEDEAARPESEKSRIEKLSRFPFHLT